MALTDQQYNQVLKYAADEMNPDERRAFESSLLENKELSDEVQFYIHLQSLTDSIEKKTSDASSFAISEKESVGKEYLQEIINARKNWEDRYETELKVKYGIGEAKGISKEDKKNRPLKTNMSRWLLAASLVGLIFLTLFLWYSQDFNQDPQVVTNNKESHPGLTPGSVKSDSQENIIQPQPVPPQDNTSSSNDSPSTSEASRNENIEKKQQRIETYTVNADKRKHLFAQNFVKDSTPPNADSRLRKAFVLYNNSDYMNAVQAFDKSETLVRRGVDANKALTEFYSDYYRALSYLLLDSTTKAISYMKDSITASPDTFWESKVQWYLALTYLKSGNINETRKLLQRISSNESAGEYKQKSLALIKELDKR